MAPALSKLTRSKPLAIGVCIAIFGITGILVYVLSRKKRPKNEAVEDQDGFDEKSSGEMQFSNLMALLESEDERSILMSLKKLGNLTAFREFQVLVREYGGLGKISSFVNSNSPDIKLQALNVTNNLAMDVENQQFLKDLIPDLVALLCHEYKASDSIGLAVTRVLTNLTTMDENHCLMTPHLYILLELLRDAEQPIKIQVLKILVNISTNSQVTENELETDIQIIRVVEDYIECTIDEEILLRAVTCLANILCALRNRWQNRHKSQISTAEFVSEDTEKRLYELQHHQNEDIVVHSGRALAALQPSVRGDTPRTRSDTDLIEVLQL